MFISPAVADDLVFVGSCSGRFFALDRRTGATVWEYDTSQDGAAAQFHGEALLADDLVVVGSDAQPAGYLYGFDRRSGRVRWKHAFAGGVAADVWRAGNSVLAVTVQGEVVALDLATGEQRWRCDDPPAGAKGSRSLDPVLNNGRLFVPWRPGVVDAFDVGTGDRLWRRDLGSVLNTSGLVVDGELVVGALDGRLYRLQPGNGAVLGTDDLGGTPYGDLEEADGCLLSLRAEGGIDDGGEAVGPHAVACLEPHQGGERWRVESPTEWGTFRPLVLGEEVVVGTQGRLLALDLETGSSLWEQALAGLPRGLGAADGVLYVGTLAGTVSAFPGGAPTNAAQ